MIRKVLTQRKCCAYLSYLVGLPGKAFESEINGGNFWVRTEISTNKLLGPNGAVGKNK